MWAFADICDDAIDGRSAFPKSDARVADFQPFALRFPIDTDISWRCGDFLATSSGAPYNYFSTRRVAHPPPPHVFPPIFIIFLYQYDNDKTARIIQKNPSIYAAILIN